MNTKENSELQVDTSLKDGQVMPSTYFKTMVRSGYAPVNGLQMYFEIHGTAAGRPLVTIHPWLGLACVCPSLTRNRQLIAVELQGHGRTADINRPMSCEQDAEDVIALLRYLRIPKTDVFGESRGGAVAMQMALRHPEMVNRVVTYASTLGNKEKLAPPKTIADSISLTPDHHSIQFERECY